MEGLIFGILRYLSEEIKNYKYMSENKFIEYH